MVFYLSGQKPTVFSVSPAGAGSCLETLEKGKPLVVVINEKLMNNHQLELAKQLHRDGHVLCCNCRYGAAVAVLTEQAVFSTITRCVISASRMSLANVHPSLTTICLQRRFSIVDRLTLAANLPSLSSLFTMTPFNFFGF